MIWIIMPFGSTFGWGVCGKYLSLKISRHTKVRFITEDIHADKSNDPINSEIISKLHVPLETLKNLCHSSAEYKFDYPVLQAIQGADLKPWFIKATAPKHIGYTFFEKTTIRKEDVLEAKKYFDWIVAGSTWCEGLLKACGITKSSTIIQGIDTSRFHKGYAEKKKYKDHFVLFSGGKLEFRKGQDLVIRAFKILQDRHDDVLLVNSWHNMWDESILSMRISPYITFDMPKGDYFKAINRLMHANGINPHKVLTLPPKPNVQMAEVYRDTDCGLFPNRCEGGTNLVLMEYMACGKPAIASLSTGHKDILTEDNCIPINSIDTFTLQDTEGRVIKQWDNPNIDEIIEKLEYAYQNRDPIDKIGKKAASFMKDMTWESAAKKFMNLLTE